MTEKVLGLNVENAKHIFSEAQVSFIEKNRVPVVSIEWLEKYLGKLELVSVRALKEDAKKEANQE